MCDDELADDDATEYFSPHRDQAAVDSADSVEESEHRHLARLLLHQEQAVCLARGVYISAPNTSAASRTCAHEAAKFLFNPSPNFARLATSARAPRPAPGGRWRGVQGHLDAHVQGKERIEHTRSSGWRRSARLIVNPDEHGLVDKDRKKEEAASASLS